MSKVKEKPTQSTHVPACFICDRIGGLMSYLGFGKFRHDSEDCRPGGCNWREWYDLHPQLHTDAGNILREHNEPRAHKEGREA